MMMTWVSSYEIPVGTLLVGYRRARRLCGDLPTFIHSRRSMAAALLWGVSASCACAWRPRASLAGASSERTVYSV